MSELKGKELELAIAEQMGRKQTPEEKLLDKVERHINEADAILLALLDVAEMGRQVAEGKMSDAEGRFNVIIDLLEQYRKGHSNLIEELYLAKKKAA